MLFDQIVLHGLGNSVHAGCSECWKTTSFTCHLSILAANVKQYMQAEISEDKGIKQFKFGLTYTMAVIIYFNIFM